MNNNYRQARRFKLWEIGDDYRNYYGDRYNVAIVM